MRRVALWRHEWVPRNMAAALQKAKGNRERARQLLDAARERRLDRARRNRVEFRHPLDGDLPAAGRARARRDRKSSRWADLDDDALAAEMADADDATLDELVAELDRRDRAQRKAAADRARRARTRAARDAAREADYERRVDAGETPEAAYAAAYGVTEERVRRDEAISMLRTAGYAGKGLDELCRSAFAAHAEESYWAAEDATNGYLVSKAGQRAKVHPRSLFTGPESRARKYASDELLAYWNEYGRLTVDDFRAGVLGGHMRWKETGAWSR